MRGEVRGIYPTSILTSCYICMSNRVLALEAHAHSGRFLSARAHSVKVLPGYPPLRPGLLTHYIRKTTWAPKEFRRNPHPVTAGTVRPSFVPSDQEIPRTDLTSITTTTTTTADDSVAASGFPDSDDSAQRAFLVDDIDVRDSLGVGEDVPVGRKLVVALEDEQKRRVEVMADVTTVPTTDNEESEAAATAAAASPQWNVCRLIVQSVTTAALPVSSAIVPSLHCSPPPPTSSSSPSLASSGPSREASSASTGVGAGAPQDVVLRDEVAEVANAIEDELASRDGRDGGWAAEKGDGERLLHGRRFQEIQVR